MIRNNILLGLTRSCFSSFPFHCEFSQSSATYKNPQVLVYNENVLIPCRQEREIHKTRSWVLCG